MITSPEEKLYKNRKMKVNTEAKGKGKPPSKRDVRVKDFHFWVEAENIFPWLIMVTDYKRVFKLYSRVVICYFFSDAIIPIPGLGHWNLQCSIMGCLSRSTLEINNLCISSVKFLQGTLLMVRSHGIHFKICDVLANYEGVFLGMRKL